MSDLSKGVERTRSHADLVGTNEEARGRVES